MPTGIEHGTVTVVADGAPYEVTTLREDVETHGRRATVRFGRDFRADAQRRDFTINALSVGADGTVHDYVGGLADLEAHRVVFIGEPAARIREDYLRILRFFRFHAAYGEGPLDPAGFSAALAERSGLAMLSRERVRAELLKLVAARRAVEVVHALADSGFAQRFLGGVVELGRFARAVAFEHEEGGHPDPVHRLAALAVIVAEDADRLRELLRLSGAEHARLAAYAGVLARMKSRAEPLDAAAVRRFVAEAGIATVRDVLTATEGEPRPRLTGDGLAAYRRFAAGEEAAPQFPLKGADLVRRGIAKGPEVGRRLDARPRGLARRGLPARRGRDGALPRDRARTLTRLKRRAYGDMGPCPVPRERRPTSLPVFPPGAGARRQTIGASPAPGAGRPSGCPAARPARPQRPGSSAIRRPPT